MFANKGLFADDEEVDLDAQAGQASARSRGSYDFAASPAASPAASSTRAPSGNFASTLTGNLDDLPATPTPAMRKQKMEEMRRAHLDKRKQKALAQPAVLRANEDQIKSSPIASEKTAGGAQAAPLSPMAPSSPIHLRQQSFGPSSVPAASPRASSAAAASSPLAPTFNGAADQGSDDEGEGAAVVDLDPGMSSMLAQKRAEQTRRHISQAERDMLEQGIAPVYDPVKPAAASASKLDMSDMRSFLNSPLPKGVLFQCFIVRNKKGLLNKLYPTYELYMSGGDERFLLSARKRTQNKTSNYMISSDKTQADVTKDSPSYMGKVRSNFVGTEFVAYDRGVNPSAAESEALVAGGLPIRQELAAVFYESNILGSKGPRKMTAVVPAIIRKDGTRAVWKPLTPEASVAVQFKRNPSSPEYLTLVNKTPKWNDVAGAYVLNFNGRVTQASVKNFQLISVDDPETVVLQFGRIGKDTFTMDLQWPLSPMQAFGITLTSFDYKFACE